MGKLLGDYDPDKISIIVCATPIDGGLAPDTFVTIERVDEEVFKEMVGALGDVVRIRNHNNLAVLTLTLMPKAPANAVLSALHTLDLNVSNGGVGPTMVRDRNGTSLHAAAKSWIKAPPNVEYGTDASPKVWKIAMILDKRVDGN